MRCAHVGSAYRHPDTVIPHLGKVAKHSVGRPLQALEFSGGRFRKFFNHMMAETRQLPDKIRSMLPDLFHNTTVGVITEAGVEGTTPNRRVVGTAKLSPGAEGFSWVLREMGKLGQSLPGVSIFLKHGQFKAEPDGGGIRPTEVSEVNHFDVATLPSAGGAITAVFESATGGSMKLFQILTRLVADRVDELNTAIAESDRGGLTMKILKTKVEADLYEACVKALNAAVSEAKDEEAEKAVAEAAKKATDDKAVAEAVAEGMDEALAREAIQEGTLPAALQKFKKKKKGEKDEKVAESDRLTKLEKESTERHLKDALAESKLPDPIKAAIRKQYLGTIFESTDVDNTVAAFTTEFAKAADAAKDDLPSLNAGSLFEAFTGGDKAIVAFDKMLDGQDGGFEGVLHAYKAFSGDILAKGPDFYGQRNHAVGLAESVDWEKNQFFRQLRAAKGHDQAMYEAINTAGFPLILADRMHKRMAKAYAEIGLDQWRKFATIERVSDFKTWRIQRFGEYGTLPTVAENGTYNALTTPGEEEVTMQIAKFGGTEQLTWESIKNDDTRRWREVPKKLARAAAWTLHTDFFDMFRLNEAIYDTDTLFHANHSNVGPTTILTNAVLRSMINTLRIQTDISAVRKIGAQPKYLMVPTEMVEIAAEILKSPGTGLGLMTGSTENAGVTNAIRTLYNIEILEIPHLSVVDDVFLVADPATVEGAAVAFLDGRDTPELFVQDLATVGTWFDRDAQTLKVRFLYDKAILDERAFVDNIVA